MRPTACCWNAGRHRGRRLCSFPERVEVLRCPFHGFAWNLDGTLNYLPARWDFPQIDFATFTLGQLKVDTWQGFVLVNPDPEAEPLEDFLGDVDMHFAEWNLKDRYVKGHVAKAHALQSAPMAGLPMALYRESKIRHLHYLLGQWVGERDAE